MSSKKKRKNELDLEALEAEYRNIYPTAQRLGSYLAAQLNKLIGDAGITLGFPIQHRVKQWSSFLDKFERVFLGVESIKEVQDLVGFRVLLLFDRDAQVVNELISGTFNVIRQYDTQERLREDQFGYSSRHFVVKLPEEWLEVPTMAQLGELQAEIQVRTLAQHIWAEASQTLQCKQEKNVPPTIRRAIYRVSALLETVDLEFERVFDQREKYRTTVEVSAADEALNVDLLETLLDSFLPKANKSNNEKYSDLLKELAYFGISKPTELEGLINKHLEATFTRENERLKREQENMAEGKSVHGTLEERVRARIFYTHTGLLRTLFKQEFGDDRVKEARREIGTLVLPQ